MREKPGNQPDSPRSPRALASRLGWVSLRQQMLHRLDRAAGIFALLLARDIALAGVADKAPGHIDQLKQLVTVDRHGARLAGGVDPRSLRRRSVLGWLAIQRLQHVRCRSIQVV